MEKEQNFVLFWKKIFSLCGFIFCMLFLHSSFAADSLSYSGRLVNADGSPVTGLVNLKADLAYTNDTTVVLCTQSFTGVTLTNGVFHLKLNLDCTPDTLEEVLQGIPTNESVAIRITDQTHAKVYSFQALHSMPLATMAGTSKTLVQMNAVDGQVLTWDGGAWKPLAPATLAAGSVGTAELADGSVTDPKVATGISRGKLAAGNPGYVLVNDGSGLINETPQLTILQGGTGASTAAGAWTNLGIVIGTAAGQFMGADAVPSCAANEKLFMTLGPTYLWDCIPDGDATKLPLAGGQMSGAIDMFTNRIIDLGSPIDPGDAANKAYVDSEIAAVNASQWTTNGTNIHFDTGNVGLGTSTPTQKLDIVGNIALSGKAMLQSDNANYVELKAPAALASTLSLTLPGTAGSAGYALTTDGNGVLSWSAVATTSTNLSGDLSGPISNAQIVAGAIVDADVSGTAAIAQSKIAGLTTALDAKEPTITAGTTAQYWRGDKSWQTLNSSIVPELTNLYFTEPRVLGTDLAGLATTAGAITATDTVLSSIGKLVGNVDALSVSQANYVLKAGDTMSGALAMGSNKITGLAEPTALADAATKNYVDTQVATKTSSQWTTSGSDIYYNSGNVGVGTTSPQGKIHTVTGGVDAVSFRADDSANGFAFRYDLVANKIWKLSKWNSTTGYSDFLTVDSNGSFGVGTSVPSAHFHVQNNGTAGGLVNGLFLQPNQPAGSSNYIKLGHDVSTNYNAADIAFTYVGSGSNQNRLDLGFQGIAPLMAIRADGNVGIGTTTPAEKLDVSGNLALTGKLRLKSDNANYVEFRAPLALAANLTFNLPGSYGTSGQALITNGLGGLSWSDVATTATAVGGDLSGTIGSAEIIAGAVGSAEIADASIVDADISLTAAIAQSKIAGLTTDLAAKEPTITAGTNAQYWRGDKSWQALNTTAVPEGSNLYFLDSRVRAAILSGYAVGSAVPIAATDTLIEALGKLEGQIIANDAAFDNTGHWSKSGSDIFFNTGNIGIGTSTPSTTLVLSKDSSTAHEHNTIRIDQYADVHSVPHFKARRGRGTAASPAYLLSGDHMAAFQGSSFGGGYSGFSIVATENHTSTAQGAKLYFYTVPNGSATPVDRVTIAQDGNVGIGTTTPLSPLEIEDRGTTTPLLIRNSATSGYSGPRIYGESLSAETALIFDRSDYAGAPWFVGIQSGQSYFTFYKSGANILNITNSGNVGIGTTTPAEKLAVQGNLSVTGEIYGRRSWGFKKGPTAFYLDYINEWAAGGGAGSSIDCTTSTRGCTILKTGTYEIRCVQRSNGTGGNPYIGIGLNGDRASLENRTDALWDHDHTGNPGSFSESNFIGTLASGSFITCGPPSANSTYLTYAINSYNGSLKIKRID